MRWYVEGIIQKMKLSSIYSISHIIVIWIYTTRIAKHNELLLIRILLLLLALPIYLGMYPGVPTHIHSYMSKPKLLLETDDKTIGYVYSGSRAYTRPRPIMFHCWYGTYREANYGQRVLFICLAWSLVIGVAAHPVEHLEAHRLNQSFNCTTYLIPR